MRSQLQFLSLVGLLLGIHSPLSHATSFQSEKATDANVSCEQNLIGTGNLTVEQEKKILRSLMDLGAFLNNWNYGKVEGFTRINAHENLLHVYATLLLGERKVYVVAVFDPKKNQVIEMVGPSLDGKGVEIYKPTTGVDAHP